MSELKILFTICARAGSKGFKNKNIQLLKGVPLVYYTLAAIRLFEEKHKDDDIVVCVNTDSEELIKQIKEQTIITKIDYAARKEVLADDITPKVSVIQDSFFQMVDKYGNFDRVIDLDITSPMRRVSDINNVIEKMKDEHYDICFSVVSSRRSPYFNIVEKKTDGFYRKVCKSNYTARQQAPKCYELNASIYGYRPSFLKNEINRTILEYHCGITIMPDYLVLDIDSGEDLKMIEYFFDYFKDKDDEIKGLYDITVKA